jgi:hypothetical protein
MGAPPAYTATRIKQWLRMANHDGRVSWFEVLKQCQSLQDLLDRLGTLARTTAE